VGRAGRYPTGPENVTDGIWEGVGTCVLEHRVRKGGRGEREDAEQFS
jgi:hypothetical protein